MSTFSHRDKSSSDHIAGPPPLNSATSQYTTYRPVIPYTTTTHTQLSVQTASSGVQSQIGARWDQDFTNTMNSGFASGTPRTENRKGVREGRETGVAGVPEKKAVGRIGKPPVAVPEAMVRAARKQKERKHLAEEMVSQIGEDEDFLSIIHRRVKEQEAPSQDEGDDDCLSTRQFARRRREGEMVVYEGVGRGPSAGEVKKKSKSKGQKSKSRGLLWRALS